MVVHPSAFQCASLIQCMQRLYTPSIAFLDAMLGNQDAWSAGSAAYALEEMKVLALLLLYSKDDRVILWHHVSQETPRSAYLRIRMSFHAPLSWMSCTSNKSHCFCSKILFVEGYHQLLPIMSELLFDAKTHCLCCAQVSPSFRFVGIAEPHQT